MRVPSSANFGFLKHVDPSLVAVGATAELLFTIDPSACLAKLRLLGERLARELAAQGGVRFDDRIDQRGLIDELSYKRLLPREIIDLLHGLRRVGNRAVHDGAGSERDALHQLKMARHIGLAVARTLSVLPTGFKPGPFVPPAAPKDASAELRSDLDQLRTEAKALAAQLADANERAELERLLREESEQEVEVLQARVEETEAAFEELSTERDTALEATQAKVAEMPASEQHSLQRALADHASEAGRQHQLTEAETREEIDQQLRLAGWDADTRTLRHSLGTRPRKGHSIAIAEWPTATGPADYALFIGTQLVGIIEAKRASKRVPAALEQAKRYARGLTLHGSVEPAGGPWGDYKAPFLYATNGRPYLKQLVEESGVWFLDVRRTTNQPRALADWPSPEGLQGLLAQDHEAAHAKLRADPMDALGLRTYQQAAIAAVEEAIEKERREILLSMATGVGKTRTAIGLVYRLLKAGRFRRILFLVDRSALGQQALGAFAEAKVDGVRTFGEIFQLAGLRDGVESSTRLHVATIQSMVRRLLVSDDEPLPIDAYDMIVVDESHRGYTLDRELSDTEFSFRDEADYISKYRRVLEHFDAVKVGLTATPALHTSEIFGPPVFAYPYREAVIDGYLVDHEPPIQIVTELAKEGIAWHAGERVATYVPEHQQQELWELPDDVGFDVGAFNRRVVTENFNRAVAGELVKHIDPEAEAKTLVFCATDLHADMFVRVLREAYVELLGEIDENLIVKITGAADNPANLIRRFKNERKPNIAVTVDLLTTGIDVPTICNLVFLRRVRSRILYDQMLGRATRLCPEIGKEFFVIFDAVDLYGNLKSEMTPVVIRPDIGYGQLAEEVASVSSEDARLHVVEEMLTKFSRKKRKLAPHAADFEQLSGGLSLDGFHDLLRSRDTAKVAEVFSAHPELATFLDGRIPRGDRIYISEHADQVAEVVRGYGIDSKGQERQRPEDYIESFQRFVRENLNELPALTVVAQRPRELTRAQLKALRLTLENAGFGEPALRAAWRDTTNKDIAASIIGYIRQAALGSTLIPYEERVDRATKRILESRRWDVHQRKWLDRIAAQLKKNTIVDRAALDERPFSAQGGFKRVNKLFDGQLEQVPGEITEELWREGA